MSKATKPIVYVLCGKTGIGKSTLLEHLRDAHSNALQILTPRYSGEPLQASMALWDSHDGIAIDEIFWWDAETVVSEINKMENTAIESGKPLILVVQCQEDLEYFQLHTTPFVIEVTHRGQALPLCFNRHTITSLQSVETPVLHG